MQRVMCLSLILLASGCSGLAKAPQPRPSGDGLCAGLEGPARAHATALASSPDDASVVTGDLLISGLIAACSYKVGGA